MTEPAPPPPLTKPPSAMTNAELSTAIMTLVDHMVEDHHTLVVLLKAKVARLEEENERLKAAVVATTA